MARSCSTTARRGWLPPITLRMGMPSSLSTRPAQAPALADDPCGTAGQQHRGHDPETRTGIEAGEPVVREGTAAFHEGDGAWQGNAKIPQGIDANDLRVAEPTAHQPLVEVFAVRTIPTPSVHHADQQRGR